MRIHESESNALRASHFLRWSFLGCVLEQGVEYEGYDIENSTAIFHDGSTPTLGYEDCANW